MAAVIDAHAKPGDIIAFCPDQLGPSVYRPWPIPAATTWSPFPGAPAPSSSTGSTTPTRWRRAIRATSRRRWSPQAGGAPPIWLVWEPGYQTYGIKCDVWLPPCWAQPPRGRPQLGGTERGQVLRTHEPDRVRARQ